MNISNGTFPRGTGLLVIVVENSNPNGDPDQESDPRRRSHDQRGMITGVSFKRKVRDLVLRKDTDVWPVIAEKLNIRHEQNGLWRYDNYQFDILEDRELLGSDVKKLIKDGEKNKNFEGFQKRFWDGRIFGNTFLEEETKGDHIRTGVVNFGLGISIAPVRVQRLTKTKMAPPGGRSDDEEGPTRGMAPLAHRIVEHGVYCMPFFVNPTAAYGKRSTGCTPLDIDLLFRLIPYAYPHTKSDIRPLVEVRHAWYAEHEGGLGSFSEFEFIEALTPARKGDQGMPSTGYPAKLLDQYDVPIQLPSDFRGTLKDGKLYDLCVELPSWCTA
jgi:CRISPR-associated protein Csd2